MHTHDNYQDRRPLTMGDLIEPPSPTEFTQAPVKMDVVDNQDEELIDLRSGSSAKIDQLVHLLKLTPGTEKSLVFSQFTSFLDKVGCGS
jgi:SWI/SNF-related matrix-associated actin-dependent regulator of chromatin subfamily A3